MGKARALTQGEPQHPGSTSKSRAVPTLKEETNRLGDGRQCLLACLSLGPRSQPSRGLRSFCRVSLGMTEARKEGHKRLDFRQISEFRMDMARGLRRQKTEQGKEKGKKWGLKITPCPASPLMINFPLRTSPLHVPFSAQTGRERWSWGVREVVRETQLARRLAQRKHQHMFIPR